MLDTKSVMGTVTDLVRGKFHGSSRQALLIGLGLAIALIISLGVFATTTIPQSLKIIGYSGHLGEWELTATLARDLTARDQELSGPLTMTHVGICTQDGPERKVGQMRVRLSRLTENVDARLLIEGVECTFNGPISEAHIGLMQCPDRRSVPLTLWAR